MSPKRLLGYLCAVLTSVASFGAVLAHDFWVQPKNYWVPANTPTAMLLEVGHGLSRQRSPIPFSRITRFDAIGPSGKKNDLRPDLRLGRKTDDGKMRLAPTGTYVLALQTDDKARSLLPAIRFNDYLKFEGLTPALRERERDRRTDADGSESYSRQAKALMQVGTPNGPGSPRITKPVGLVLEIVPEINPYTIPRPRTLPIRVFYENRPLGGALVMLTDLNHDATPQEVHRTQRDGSATFAMPAAGDWLLNVVWTKVAPASSDVDFETVFSSLSFGFSGEQTNSHR